MFTTLLEDMIKETVEQPDEEIRRAGSGRVPGAGASVPVDLGGTTLLGCECVRSRSSLHPILLGFLWRPHHIGMIC